MLGVILKNGLDLSNLKELFIDIRIIKDFMYGKIQNQLENQSKSKKRQIDFRLERDLADVLAYNFIVR